MPSGVNPYSAAFTVLYNFLPANTLERSFDYSVNFQSQSTIDISSRSQTRHFDPPTLVDSCRVSLAHNSSMSKEPFFLDEEKHRSALGKL